MKEIIWVAHPIAGDVAANIAGALRWLAWLRHQYREAVFFAPYIANLMSGEDDADPAQRAHGMEDNCAIIRAGANSIALVGGRFSDGMRRETVAIQSGAQRCCAYDMTSLGREPPLRKFWPLIAEHAMKGDRGRELDQWIRPLSWFETPIDELLSVGPACVREAPR